MNMSESWARAIEEGKAQRVKAGTTGFRFVAVSDLAVKPPEFVVDSLIETETMGLIFGDPGCGKSFLAVDLGLSVAAGHPFHGHDVQQGAVFYIAGEGHSGLARRFHAWAKDRGRPLEGVPLYKSERAAQFLDAKSAAAVADAITGLADEHGAPALIIVDTLARNFGPGDENHTPDMSKFVAAMDDLRERWPGCVVIIVHHSGHAEKQRARGAMALKGALDFEYRMKKDGPHIEVVNTKMKDAEPPPDMYFELVGMPLDDGASSAVLIPGNATKAKGKKLTSAQQRDMTTFEEAAKESGRFGEDGSVALDEDDWRAVYYRRSTAPNQEAKRKAFDRAKRNLADAGLIEVCDNTYFLVDDDRKNALRIMQAFKNGEEISLVAGYSGPLKTPGQPGHVPDNPDIVRGHSNPDGQDKCL